MSTPSRPGAASDHDELIDALVQSAFGTMSVLSRVAAEHDLSLTQLRVLGILRDRRLRMTSLAQHLGLEKSTLTGLVDRAEQRGLLKRGPNRTDGRVVDVFITRAGARLADQGYVRVAELLAARTTTLTATERARLTTLLGRTSGPGPR